MKKLLLLLAFFLSTSMVALFEFDRAVACQQANDWKSSLSFLEGRLIEQPHNSLYLYHAGLAHYKLGNFEFAQNYFEKFVNSVDSQDIQSRIKGLFNQGNALFKSNKFEAAIAAYDTVLLLDNQNTYAITNKKLAEEKLKQRNDQQQSNQDQNKSQDDKKEDNKESQQKKDQSNPTKKKNQSEDSQKPDSKDQQSDSSQQPGDDQDSDTGKQEKHNDSRNDDQKSSDKSGANDKSDTSGSNDESNNEPKNSDKSEKSEGHGPEKSEQKKDRDMEGSKETNSEQSQNSLESKDRSKQNSLNESKHDQSAQKRKHGMISIDEEKNQERIKKLQELEQADGELRENQGLLDLLKAQEAQDQKDNKALMRSLAKSNNALKVQDGW
jgi:hypothetical protein